MKIFRVIDDGDCVLTTADELVALRRFRKVAEERNVTVCWIDDEEVR